MKLSLVIPAYNEELNLPATINTFYDRLQQAGIDHEILVVNDNSKDNTVAVLEEMMKKISSLRYINNTPPNGFGYCVRKGLEHFTGDCVAIVMADLSDSPDDLASFYQKMVEGNYDCVFGSRFIKGGKTYG